MIEILTFYDPAWRPPPPEPRQVTYAPLIVALVLAMPFAIAVGMSWMLFW